MPDLQCSVTDEHETLSLYLMSDENEMKHACVSIGHIDYDATFYFACNADAILCFESLRKVTELRILD